ncbi:hypothetical protein WME73_37205 [Sorangium sp. So ce302]
MQTLDCFDRCYKRKASPACIGCCRDHDFLCSTQQKYSYDFCEGGQ